MTRRFNKKSLWVIFSGPQQRQAPGTKYYNRDGSGVTDLKHNAAKFDSFEEAKEFAEEKKIELTTLRYIGQKDFWESDLWTE